MIQKVFGIRDTKALAFLQPFFSSAVGSAIRAFDDNVNGREGVSQLSKHPEDYLLYELAEFDDQTGEFISHNPIKMLGCGKDFVVAKPAVTPGVGNVMSELVPNGK